MYHINKEIVGNGENIYLKDTAKHYFKKFDILGNSKQETRSGKNKLNMSKIQQTTKNGVTCTYNSVENTITLNGECTTDNTVFALQSGTINAVQNKTTLTGYYISGSVNERAYARLYNTAFSRSLSITLAELNSTNKIISSTYSSTDDALTQNRIQCYAGTIFDNLTIRLMVTDEVDTEYEQYGISPSVEYPAPIESVGDNINLLDLSNALEKGTSDGITAVKNSDNTYTINGTAGTNGISNVWILGSYNNTKVLFTIPAGTYTLTDVLLMSYDGTTRTTFKPSPFGNPKTTTLEKDFNVTGVRITELVQGETYTDLKIYPKLEKGTKSTSYSPYGQGSIGIIKSNKNFLDIGNDTFVSNGLNITNEISKITVNGTLTSSWATGSKSKKCLLKAGSYIFSIDKPLSHHIYLDITFEDGTSTVLQINRNTLSKQITTNKNIIKYNVGFSGVTSGQTYNEIIYLQLEKGTEATDYVEHQSQTKAIYTQQPFRAIGDVKDRFVKKDGVWYEEHNINGLTLNGTEEWNGGSYSVNSTRYRYFYTTVPVINSFVSLCNRLTPFTKQALSSGTTENNVIGFALYNTNNLRIILDETLLEDTSTVALAVSSFKTWLSENNVTVNYILATPTLIECTPEQVEILEYLDKEIKSYDEQTNISSTDAISPTFDVIAYQRIPEEFKTRLKEGKITRGYLKALATDTLPEIIINENNYLKDFKIEELRYVPEEGFIGGAVAKRVTGNFNNVDNSFDIQDREVEVYLGVELEDETTEYIKYGTYTVQRPEDDQVNDNTSFEALDYMVKFNQEYKDRITYPCTLKQLLDDIVDQAGVNSKIATFANSEFVVENNQFEQGTTLRDVLKAITQMAFNWSRIDADDNLVMDFDIKEDIDEELGTDDYFGFKKTDDYGPVNVIVLRNSQVEGENVTIKDEELINTPKGYNLINARYNVDIKGNDAYKIKVEPNTYYLLTLEQICIALGENTRSQHWYKIFDKEDNKLKEGTIIPFDFTEANEIKSGKKSLLMPETADYISIDLGSYNATPNTLRNLEVQFIKGEEEKPYQPFVPTGEIELVIADNPFAYTELKRKQLIEAGRRLFGLRYTPMAVDMLGLMYLNAKDRISVENLNGEKFNTYLLDHTIDYTGIVLDSMQSQAKTKTETKYQYISPLAQGLSHVEIRVDKANKKIEAVIQDQQDISEKVAKSISRVEVVYALSDSPTKAPTDGWSTTAPEWEEEKYMWQKTVTIYANGTTVESAATNISGAKGEDGLDGIGISSIIEQYYLSTSNTEQTGGSWKETQDSWAEGYYIWTRSKITWEDKSITYSDPILAEVLNNLNEDTKIIKNTLVKQESTTQGLLTTVSETTEKLNTEYLTADDVNKKINDVDSKYTTLEGKVTTIETKASGVETKVTTILNNGVEKVTTTTGYTFDDVGLTISKTGKEMTTQITEDGMDIYRDKGEITEEKVLEANSSGVYAYDLHAKTFLIVGESSRFEDYIKNNKKRTGCFWIGETEV